MERSAIREMPPGPGPQVRKPRQGGFTLLEVMVTVLLIGIITGFAVLSLRGSAPGERLAEEARRLTALLEMTRQEALLLGEQRGIRFTETGYTVLALNRDGEWRLPDRSGLLKAYRLPADMTLKLWVDNRPVDFARVPKNLPQVLLLSSGESTDFRAVLQLPDAHARSYQVSGDLTGRLEAGAVP